jgi:hypothetical protein
VEIVILSLWSREQEFSVDGLRGSLGFGDRLFPRFGELTMVLR